MRTHDDFCSEVFERKNKIIKKRKERKRIVFACVPFALCATIALGARIAIPDPLVGGEIGETVQTQNENTERPPVIENADPKPGDNVAELPDVDEGLEEKSEGEAIGENVGGNEPFPDDEWLEVPDNDGSQNALPESAIGESDPDNYEDTTESLETTQDERAAGPYDVSQPYLEAGEDPYPFTVGGEQDANGLYATSQPYLEAGEDPYPFIAETQKDR